MLLEKRTFVIKGNDARNPYLAEILMREGYAVALWDTASHEDNIPQTDLRKISMAPCILILAFSTPQEELMPILQHLQAGSICFGGQMEREALEYANRKNITYHNILEHPVFPILNAVPTAEGALLTVMQNTPYTVRGSRMVVLGFGRVAKAVARLFYACRCEVTVACRSEEGLAYAQMEGYRVLPLSELASASQTFNIVINTVPAPILTGEVLSGLRKDGLILELASGQNNIDYVTAQKLGLRIIRAGGLPGKVAPASAARAIKDTVLSYLKH